MITSVGNPPPHPKARRLHPAGAPGAPARLAGKAPRGPQARDRLPLLHRRQKPSARLFESPGGSEATHSGCAGAPPLESSLAGCSPQPAVIDNISRWTPCPRPTASVGGPRVHARQHQSADPTSAPDSLSRRTPCPLPTASVGGPRVHARQHQSVDPGSAPDSISRWTPGPRPAGLRAHQLADPASAPGRAPRPSAGRLRVRARQGPTPISRRTSRPRPAGPHAHQSADSVSALGTLDVVVGFIINNKTLRPTFPSCPEAQRLHPAGELAQTHLEHVAPVARPSSAAIDPLTPSSAPTTAKTLRPTFPKLHGGYTQRVRSRAPAGSKPRLLQSAAGHHRHLLHQRQLKNLRST